MSAIFLLICFSSCSPTDPNTLLFDAVKENNRSAVMAAISDGADVNAVQDNLTPFILAVQNKNLEIMKVLLEHHADPDYVHGEKDRVFSAMQTAVETGDIELVPFLLDHSVKLFVDMEITHDRNGNPLNIPVQGALASPLTAAVNQGDLAMLRFLLDQGADPNIPLGYDDLPAVSAINREHGECLQLLLDRGADSESAMFAAIMRQDLAAVKMILPKYRNSLPLALACSRGTESIVDLFLKAGAEVNDATTGVSYALIEATKKGNLTMVKQLLEYGANVNTGGKIENALFHASYYGYLDIAKLLLEHGADALSFNMFGESTIHYAIDYGNVEIALLLMDEDINLDLPRGTDKETPLILAVRSGYPELVARLLEKGVKVNAIDGYHKTALDHAKDGENKEIIEMLKSHDANTARESKDDK